MGKWHDAEAQKKVELEPPVLARMTKANHTDITQNVSLGKALTPSFIAVLRNNLRFLQQFSLYSGIHTWNMKCLETHEQ